MYGRPCIHAGWGGRLSTVPCVRFLQDLVWRFRTMEGLVSSSDGGTSIYRPLCSVYIGFSMAFRGGDGVRYPPPCREARS